MRDFACPNCGQRLAFENSVCLNCGSSIGFDLRQRDFVALGPDRESPSMSRPGRCART